MHPNNLASVPLTVPLSRAARRRRTFATCLLWTLALLALGCLSFGSGLAVRGGGGTRPAAKMTEAKKAAAAAADAAARVAAEEAFAQAASSGAIQRPREYSADPLPESSGREEDEKLEVPSPSSEAEAADVNADAAAASDEDAASVPTSVVDTTAIEHSGVDATATATEQGEVDAEQGEVAMDAGQGEVDWAPLIANSLDPWRAADGPGRQVQVETS